VEYPTLYIKTNASSLNSVAYSVKKINKYNITESKTLLSDLAANLNAAQVSNVIATAPSNKPNKKPTAVPSGMNQIVSKTKVTSTTKAYHNITTKMSIKTLSICYKLAANSWE
jgi:hypothetical protein